MSVFITESSTESQIIGVAAATASKTVAATALKLSDLTTVIPFFSDERVFFGPFNSRI
jgi:hypothetical protein